MPKRIIQGKVVSDKMDKTIVVAVESRHPHHRYGKVMKRTNKFKAHDENNEAHEGDLVEIVESRPLSREKRWALQTVVIKAQ